ncbi:hypothetical protein FOXG_14875 [Fusarium oxysporum f. sp. lycopersici 4287]|uniref:Uncharacterized protein n=2 Tax=Fusarium oxysporum TaxID=5507 RepID=A0A0J9W151_FUSO4|nr:hypothetical protein FOXG_14875 [Fusarium oxysporum f. sp. lycopersici 4287]KNB16834.1 hypothetical protein FOXG_14875 [Fusarium oxysporum f. sp. lycopersici 4287]
MSRSSNGKLPRIAFQCLRNSFVKGRAYSLGSEQLIVYPHQLLRTPTECKASPVGSTSPTFISNHFVRHVAIELFLELYTQNAFPFVSFDNHRFLDIEWFLCSYKLMGLIE